MSEGSNTPPSLSAGNDPVALGSTSWIGADNYESGGDFHDRALKTLNEINWDRLLTISSSLRNGTSCRISQSFSIGHFNMVRRIEFADGISWVARVRLPEMKSFFGDREMLDDAETLRVELASMNFLKRAKTSIPVPEVHSYNADPANDVGASYVLMDYIHGTVASELRSAKECHPLFGTPEQDRHFREQMAEIQVTLSTFKFDQIGSLYQDENTSEFLIGPDLVTGKGPWKSSAEYYNDVADHALRACLQSSPDLQETPSFTLPILFKHLMSVYSNNSSDDSFSLVNRDFGAHNLLVDDEFRIVGVIDFDGMMAAPIEVVAQYPVLTGLDQEPPGHIETNLYAIERIKETKPKLKEYKEMVRAAESRLGGSETVTRIADLLESDAASVFHGILSYQQHQDFVNDEWMLAYTKLLRDHAKSRGD
ncbi:kinaselike domain [Fusarium sporotrichioides]|uniref:Kinaselike domain n=1 Tax=Fusarium sporotrichioides TaxID=5514 RepID=A0A395S2K3_FUSSP|nr:kinaselike domain [Fusarium sporotrichioides]